MRVALGLKEGDELAYEIEGDHVVPTGRRAGNPFAAFTEWGEDADRRACDGF